MRPLKFALRFMRLLPVLLSPDEPPAVFALRSARDGLAVPLRGGFADALPDGLRDFEKDFLPVGLSDLPSSLSKKPGLPLFCFGLRGLSSN